MRTSHCERAEHLTACKADLNSKDREGGTSLYGAAILSHPKMVRWCYGANLNLQSCTEKTPTAEQNQSNVRQSFKENSYKTSHTATFAGKPSSAAAHWHFEGVAAKSELPLNLPSIINLLWRSTCEASRKHRVTDVYVSFSKTHSFFMPVCLFLWHWCSDSQEHLCGEQNLIYP